MSQDKKKQAKQKKREREVRQRKIEAHSDAILRAKREKYPDILVGRRDADPKFIECIIEASKSIDFCDTKSLGSGQQAFYKAGKDCGFEAAINLLHSLPSINYGDQKISGNVKVAVAMTILGCLLLSKVPEEVRRRHMPFNDVAVAFQGRDIILNFSSMQSQSGSGGRIHFNRLKPKIVFDEKEYTVGFSRHAIEQICKRLNPRYIEYGPAGDIHALFNACVYLSPLCYLKINLHSHFTTFVTTLVSANMRLIPLAYWVKTSNRMQVASTIKLDIVPSFSRVILPRQRHSSNPDTVVHQNTGFSSVRIYQGK